MRTRFVCLVMSAAVVCVCLASCGQREPEQVDTKIADHAKAFVDLLVAGDFETAAAEFDPTMAAAMSPAKLEEAWESLATLGEYEGQAGVTTAQEQGLDVAYVTCTFTNESIAVKVVFSADGKIGGLWFVPPLE